MNQSSSCEVFTNVHQRSLLHAQAPPMNALTAGKQIVDCARDRSICAACCTKHAYMNQSSSCEASTNVSCVVAGCTGSSDERSNCWEAKSSTVSETVASVRLVALGSSRVATLGLVVSPFPRKDQRSWQKDPRTLRC